MSAEGVDKGRRRFLTAATSVVGAAGAAAVVVPFVLSMQPSERAKAAGAPVEADISKLESGQMMTVEWRGKPVWIVRRTGQNLKDMASLEAKLLDPASDNVAQQPAWAKNPARSQKEELLVLVGICTHLGCSPTYRPDIAPADLGADWKGGFFCPCHGSKFDLAGRVYSGVPAPSNMVVPPYKFLTDTTILVGDDEGVAA
ncbi:MAG: ubiquinol-cytochrome c reductase iron-sulfur subunit [Gammaproteobacteria bacterium]|nr:ubiquinol-cytochrome c reductase iron-sulfur subunit [Gammaproteobacteria bacterium]